MQSLKKENGDIEEVLVTWLNHARLQNVQILILKEKALVIGKELSIEAIVGWYV